MTSNPAEERNIRHGSTVVTAAVQSFLFLPQDNASIGCEHSVIHVFFFFHEKAAEVVQSD